MKKNDGSIKALSSSELYTKSVLYQSTKKINQWNHNRVPVNAYKQKQYEYSRCIGIYETTIIVCLFVLADDNDVICPECQIPINETALRRHILKHKRNTKCICDKKEIELTKKLSYAELWKR